ncbi:MAG: ribonuclease HII [Candidatus Bathyarchaeia archaeon]
MIGPLVIAGVVGTQETIRDLAKVGVADSKTLSAKQRISLADEIKKLATAYVCIEVSPREIDKVVASSRKFFKLNYLEAKFMAKAIEMLRPSVAFVDSCDVVPKRFSGQINSFLKTKTRIIAEHRADRRLTIVGAASILAKTTRDHRVSELAQSFGTIGSGYPSDSKTISFLQNWLVENNDFPNFVRKSWATARRIKTKAHSRQATLKNY